MHERISKIRQENPNFDKKLVDIFAEKMPKLMLLMIEGEEYDCHIGSKEVAELGKEFIVNKKGEHIGFHWECDEVERVANNYIKFSDMDFYEYDLWLWANVKYGEHGHIESDGPSIIKMAIADLCSKNFPYYNPSHIAYKWLKKHIENEEKE